MSGNGLPQGHGVGPRGGGMTSRRWCRSFTGRPIAHAEAAAWVIPGAEPLRVEGAGHGLVFDRADRVIPRIAAFLSSLAGDG
jgi:hypothetical protein